MKLTRLITAASTAVALLASAASAQNGFALKDGDRVVFYGDSITESRQYNNMVETYVLTRFPKLNVKFIGSGWSGDRVTGAPERLQRDVLAHNPTVVTTMFGMNDGSYLPLNEARFETYSKGYQAIVDTLKQGAPGVRITLIQPSPYDDVTRPPNIEGGYNTVMVRFGQYVKELADKEKLHVADLNTPVVEMLQKANATAPALAARIIGDRVHPGQAGHLIMGKALLKSWNAPALVTAVEIDAKTRKVVRAENTTITNFKGNSPLSWTQTDASLPFPINMTDQFVALAVKSSDVIEQLNQQPLKVSGLSTGNYQLKIDDSVLGTFTALELSNGINLATLDTPMMKQAGSVAALTNQRSSWRHERWRNVQIPLEKLAKDDSPEVKSAAQTSLPTLLKAMDAKEAVITEQQRAQTQPVPRTYNLTLQP